MSDLNHKFSTCLHVKSDPRGVIQFASHAARRSTAQLCKGQESREVVTTCRSGMIIVGEKPTGFERNLAVG